MSKLNDRLQIRERDKYTSVATTQTAMSVGEIQIPILSSRFSTDTWGENETYRTRRNSRGCIYGCPLRISSKIHINMFAYVLEMNNTTNRI
jgi:hypothetical protein